MVARRAGSVAVWLIRHGESVWNAEGRWQGQADPRLSARGEQQARRLAERLAGERFALLVASDLVRARQTAEALAARWEMPLRLEPRLREIDAGRWQGLTHPEIEARDRQALARFRSGDPDARAGGGESRREAATRARAALEALVRETGGARVAVVTHGGIVLSLLPGVRLANTEWAPWPARGDAGVLEPPAGDGFVPL